MAVEQAKKSSSLDGLEGTISVDKGSWLRRLFAFVGPAYLVSVGYMDPGNWATDIEGGARFGYMLIWVILMSNLMAILLQTLSARMGIVTGYDLAQGCRREYPPVVNYLLWILAEIAIAATDLAEALGTILGLNLLFGLPLLWGCLVTAFDTFLLLAIQRFGMRKMEAFIVMLIGTMGACFVIEIFLAQPHWGGIVGGFVPRLNASALYIAIGIIGATVMPHNLYLHSSLVQSRAVPNTQTAKAEACGFNLIDSAVALNAAFFVNAAILVMAAAVFHSRGIVVTEIQQAYKLLEPILGTHVAPVAFALALIASGQSSTLTGTLAGQTVMEGFLDIRLRPWLRRLLTRGLALIPAVIVIAISGNEGTYKLLILSQVILSLQLPFATIPLIHFTSDRKKMGRFANKAWVATLSWIVAAIIVVLNMELVYDTLRDTVLGGPLYLQVLVFPVVLFLLGMLIYIAVRPWIGESHTWENGLISAGRAVVDRIKPIRIHNICVAVEHADGDADVISAALGVVRRRASRLTLLHVVETTDTLVFGDQSQSLHSREDEAYLEELVREVETDGIPVNMILRYGNPPAEIIRTVNEGNFDLLVMGSHGHGAVGDIVYGQTVTTVRHGVSIPVLIARSARPGHESAS